MKRFPALFAALLLLSGCTATGTRQPTAPQILPDPMTFGRSAMAFQHLSGVPQKGSQAGRTVSAEAAVAVSPAVFKMSLLAPQGGRIWDISTDGRTISENRIVPIPDEMEAERLIVDAALVWWPKGGLLASVRPDVRLRIEEGDGIRLIYLGNPKKLAYTIRYSKGAQPGRFTGHAELEQHLLNYRLSIESEEIK